MDTKQTINNIIFNYPDCIEASRAFDLDLDISGSFDRQHYSASFLKGWQECPARTFLSRFSDLLEAPEAPALLIGTAVHALLEKYYSENLSQEELLNLCTPEYLGLDQFDVYKVIEYIKAYFKIKPYKQLNNVERKTEELIYTDASPLGVDLPVKIKGFIDRIDASDEGFFIIDYKTASRELADDACIDQMILYKWAFEAAYGVEPDGVYIASLFVDNPRYIKQEFTLQKQSVLIDKIFDIDEEVKISMNERKYKKKPNMTCRWCPFKAQCNSSQNKII